MLIPLYMDYCETRLPPASAYRVTECKVPVDGGEIAVRCLTPTPSRFPPQAFPLLVWYHSGGWTAGTLDLDDYYLRSICVELGLAVVNVDYRLAPEHPFPTGVHDAYAALKWTATHASELSADPARGFLVGGMSAGANLAAAVAIRARDDAFFARTRLTGQVLQMPCVVHPDAYPEQYKSELRSMEQHADAPFLAAHKLRTFWHATQAPPADPLFSPLLAPSHARLPRTYVQVCGLDPLRDEGLLYARVLREAGVITKLDVSVHLSSFLYAHVGLIGRVRAGTPELRIRSTCCSRKPRPG
ncbi:AB hydrolase superfamily protein B1A11.02 [Grifola frondosa]|uniref:AB hydrolase superfamily protein B1A11.02 n=1 Tax=Grifola frondosa TaxID=5627 RepID=A0A1C7LU86_GRIFR|nr:AB hydrolase superfamily protein B1A11.02 [Grifola frondosa]